MGILELISRWFKNKNELKDEKVTMLEGQVLILTSEKEALQKQLDSLTKQASDYQAMTYNAIARQKELQAEIDSRGAIITQLNEKIATLSLQLAQKPIVSDPLEAFWNNKRPKADVLYKGRPYAKYGQVNIDVRAFFNIYDSVVPNVSGSSDDDKALNSLKWVINNITYVSDISQDGFTEYWQFPYETMFSKKGDCEDGAILMANIMLKSGIPYWRIRLNAGDVKGGGHAYVTYLASDNEWYIMDWCYWPQDSLNSFLKVSWKNRNENYWGIWFSWNERYSFYDSPNDTSVRSDFLNNFDMKVIV